MIWRFAVATLLFSACVIAGVACTSHQPYPNTWPALGPPQHSCERFIGSYRNRGGTASGPYPLHLTEVFFGQNSWKADVVALSFPRPDQLQATALSDDRELMSGILSSRSGDFACKRGTLVIRRGAQWEGYGAPGPVAVSIRKSVTLDLKIAEGYLIVRKRQSELMILTFIPVLHRESEWHRFERVR